LGDSKLRLAAHYLPISYFVEDVSTNYEVETFAFQFWHFWQSWQFWQFALRFFSAISAVNALKAGSQQLVARSY
jgi:hypothetical protein